MPNFKIDPKKRPHKVQNMLVAMDPDLYRWVKVMAAMNEVNISSVLNQAIEYAKRNSERITL